MSCQRRYTSNKHMKRWSTLYVIQDLQNQRMAYHYVSIRTAKVQNTDNKKLLPKMWNDKNTHSLLKKEKWYRNFEDSLAVSYKLNTVLTYNSAIVLLGNYPNELKT